MATVHPLTLPRVRPDDRLIPDAGLPLRVISGPGSVQGPLSHHGEGSRLVRRCRHHAPLSGIAVSADDDWATAAQGGVSLRPQPRPG